jgi:hypothetical protein
VSVNDPKWQQIYSDCDNAFSIAKQLWQGARPSDEALQSTFATVLIHSKSVTGSSSPQAAPATPAPRQSWGAAPTPAQPTLTLTPSQEAAAPDKCKKCGGTEFWDNRNKKKTPKSPDFRCKDKDCGEGVWLAPKQ